MRLPVDNFGLTQGWNPPVHYGLDLAKSMNTPILSPVFGKVIAIGTNRNYIGGLYVIIREYDDEGLEYYTGHHDSISVIMHQSVAEGQQIAKMGMTGTATGPHTHFQIRKNNAGALIDPSVVLKRKGTSMVSDKAYLDRVYKKVLRRIRGAGEGENVYLGKDAGWVFLDIANSAEAGVVEQALVSREKAIADLALALANEKNKPPVEVIKIVEKIVTKIEYVDKIVEPIWLVKVRDFILGFLKFKKG